MSIACVILSHGALDVTQDTVDSVKDNVTADVLLLADKAGWHQFDGKDFGCRTECGLWHGLPQSPYRNYALGLVRLAELYPSAEWYIYAEYDVLFTSPGLKADLYAAPQDVLMMGCDLREHPFDVPLLADLTKVSMEKSYYLLGCFHCLRGGFVREFVPLLRRILDATRDVGQFPGYERYAFEEEMMPTIAVSAGGRLKELSCWTGEGKMARERWRGSLLYQVRFEPMIRMGEVCPAASVLHPLKKMDAVREHYRALRSL